MQSRRLLGALKLCALAALVASIVALMGGVGPAEGTFPGANGRIAFHTTRDGNAEVYVMEADGSGVMRLTYNMAPDEDPAWSADGQKIAFTSERDGNREIYAMNADGTGQMNLTNHPSFDHTPSWSPDGSQLTFGSNRDGNPEIYVMDADGSGVTRLTSNPAYDVWPAWSPNGSQIVFFSSRDDPNAGTCFLSCDNYEVYVMNVNGGELTRLTSSPGFDGDPAWSPDASQIVFVSDRDGSGDVHVMNADGSGQTNVSNNPANDTSPAWSPDGSKIAFRSNRDGNYEVYVVEAGGGEQKNLTKNPAADTRPDWEPRVPAATPTSCGPEVCVGGVAEQPAVAGTPLEAGGTAGLNVDVLAGAVAGFAASALALGGAAWYARRRWASR